MPLQEIVFKATFDAFFFTLTRRFPSTKIFIWCNKENDVVEVVVKNPDEFPLVMEEIRSKDILDIIEDSTIDNRICVIVHKCHCMMGDTIVRHIGQLDILNIFPNFIENGWSYHRLIVFKHEDLRELLRRLEKWGWNYKILRKVPFDGFLASSLTITADTLFSELTNKQIDALLTAYRHGYYNLPRNADVQTIATKENVSRTTFQEHLKKAENKLVASLVPYVQLFGHAPASKRKSLRVK